MRSAISSVSTIPHDLTHAMVRACAPAARTPSQHLFTGRPRHGVGGAARHASGLACELFSSSAFLARAAFVAFLSRNGAFKRRQEQPCAANKDADAPADPQLHVPFVGFHDDSDSPALDHQVISDAASSDCDQFFLVEACPTNCLRNHPPSRSNNLSQENSQEDAGSDGGEDCMHEVVLANEPDAKAP